MKEIILNFNRKDFEELYLRDNKEKIFFSPTTKEDTKLLLIFGVICILFLVGCIYTDESWSGLIFFLIIFAIQSIILGKKVVLIIKWRKAIKNYLDEVEMHKNNKIVLTEKNFSLIQDANETIERWTNFKRVKITEEFIQLYGDENYLIPKKSMKAEDYEILKKELRNKINEG